MAAPGQGSATAAGGATPGTHARSIGADRYERVLARASGALFAAALLAIARGRGEWALVPGALVIAGFFTFPVGPLPGRWLGG